VFAYKGENLDEYWDFTHRIFEWHDGGLPNMILDDGGDATLLLHLGTRAEKDASVIAKQRRRNCALCGDCQAPQDPPWLVLRPPGCDSRCDRRNHYRRSSLVPDAC